MARVPQESFGLVEKASSVLVVVLVDYLGPFYFI